LPAHTHTHTHTHTLGALTDRKHMTQRRRGVVKLSTVETALSCMFMPCVSDARRWREHEKA
jgi:hypothetical protein